MKAISLNLEMAAIKVRTYRTIGFSLVVHIALLLLFALYHTVAPASQGITEISWIEPVRKKPPLTTEIARASMKAVANRETSLHRAREFFRRVTSKADFSHRPQKDETSIDKLNERLASLQRDASTKNKAISDLAAPSSLNRPSLAGIPKGEQPEREKVDLTRSQGSGRAPIELSRSSSKSSRPVMAVPKMQETEITPATADKTESTARRNLAGALLVGPVADRQLITYETPAYPEWAKREAVEASVNLYFVVLPNGRVKENILIEKTSGFEEFDRNAIDALLTWRFEPLGGGVSGEQWGSITFHYRLKDAKR